PRREQARERVVHAAGRESDHELDGSGGPALRLRRAQHGTHHQGKQDANCHCDLEYQPMKAESPGPRYNRYEAPHADLREFIARVEEQGELLRIPGVDWNLEMGALAEAVYQGAKDNPPAILFEDIPGYPKGFRVLSGATNSSKRLAITLGFPVPGHPLDV